MSEPHETSPRGRRLGGDTNSLDNAKDISSALTSLLAAIFALYLKTKNFHRHMSGPHFCSYHLMLDEQSNQILAMSDPMAERVRKIGGSALRSIGQVSRLLRISDNDADCVGPFDMLAELRENNLHLVAEMRKAHSECNDCGGVATASLLENWIDESEGRVWFLTETTRSSRLNN